MRIDLARAKADGTFHEGAGPGRWGVLSALEPASTVIRNARLSTGPFSIAADLPSPLDLSVGGLWRNRYGVCGPEGVFATVTGNARLALEGEGDQRTARWTLPEEGVKL